jgi:hypothetical protein
MEQPTKATRLPAVLAMAICVWILFGIRFEAIRVSKSSSPRSPRGRKETVGLNSANAKADVADGLTTEAFLELS